MALRSSFAKCGRAAMQRLRAVLLSSGTWLSGHPQVWDAALGRGEVMHPHRRVDPAGDLAQMPVVGEVDHLPDLRHLRE